jgi:hypothetical protein
MGMNCSSLLENLLFYLSSPSATLPVNSFLLYQMNNSSADFATSPTADRLLDLHLETFEDTESEFFKPYVEDLLEDFNWPGSRCHY